MLKRFYLVLFLMLSGLFPASVAAENDANFTLTVTVEEIASDRGHIAFGIFDDAKGFLQEGKQLQGERVQAQKGSVKLFVSLPPGRYAIACYHDENDNQKLDTGLLGVPVEGFCFSNNPNLSVRPPSFDEAVFEVKENTETEIKLRYLMP